VIAVTDREDTTMAATTNGAGIIRAMRAEHSFEDAASSLRYAQGSFLDELPGLAFGLITLAYVFTALYTLL
jgi:hypothetical protein